MKEVNQIFLKHISTIYRNTNRYLDISLEEDQIGAGQQFFLTYIYENEGITMYDLAKIGNFDKGTVTKAVQKLMELGYVISKTDENDKRVKHIYVTEKAHHVLERVYEIRKVWKKRIVEGLSKEEVDILSEILEKMSDNSRRGIQVYMESRQS